MNTSALSGTTRDRASIVLITLVLALVFLTFKDYGITWDEPQQDEYGDLVVDYYLSRLGDGVEWKAQDLPPNYYVHYFTIVLPEMLLVLLPLSVVAVLTLAAKHRDKTVSPIAGELVLVAVAAIYPLIHVVVFRAVVYDGVRHMLFVLPLIAALAGSTLAWLIAARQVQGLDVCRPS